MKNFAIPINNQQCTAGDLLLGKDMAWFKAMLGRLPRGTNLLCSGDPGVGKSTLVQQLALSAASKGEKVLYITTEQTAETVTDRLTTLSAGICRSQASRSCKNINVIDDLVDLSLLYSFLSRHVFGPAGKYSGTTAVAIDSLQGSGVASHDRKYWNAIYEYFRQSAAAGLTTFALAHLTKANQIAGPRSLEHQVDVTMLMRPGVSCRSLYLPKNRNGASREEPYALSLCPETSRIQPSSLSTASSATVHTMGDGEMAPMEVSISVPRYDRGYAKACGLPRPDVDAILSVLETCTHEAHAIRNYGVIVRGAAHSRYRRDQNLAVALAALAAMTRKEVDVSIMAVGDLSLRGFINSPSPVTLATLESMVAAGELQDFRLLTGPGIPITHPLRSQVEIMEATTLKEAWSRCLP